MSRQTVRPCLAPGCPTLVPRGYCDRHRDAYAPPSRGRWAPSDPGPWTTPQWRATSRGYLARHPVCEHPGCTEPARVVHHVAGDGRLGTRADTSDGNLRALCRAHHLVEHNQLRRAARTR